MLTHQQLFASFYVAHCSEGFEKLANNSLSLVAQSDLGSYPLPRLIDRFFCWKTRTYLKIVTLKFYTDMAGLNKVMLIGRLGKDPEVISFENGGKKMTVSLATSERYRDRNGQWQDQTEWHNIVAWGNLANGY